MMIESKRIFKEPNKINFPADYEIPSKKLSIYDLLLQTNGDYKKVCQILDHKISETNDLISDLTENINTLTNQDFEEKLEKLKNENLETMFLCDEFRKITVRKEKENFDHKDCDNEKAFQKSSGKLYEKPPPIPKFDKNSFNGYTKTYNNRIFDMEDAHSLDSFTIPYYYEAPRKQWKEFEDIDDEREINERERNYKRDAAMERLTNSKSISKYEDESEKNYNPFDSSILVSKWRHKVTIPQPFEMTVRDELKKRRQTLNDSRRSSTLLEFQTEKKEKERQEMEEMKKQFKANPVPAHVYIPLYESMQEESNQRRQFIKEYNKELLKSIEKPFKFYKRDLEKQKFKSESALQPNSKPLTSYHSERQKTIFRAKRVPRSTNDSLNNEKMKEDELLRLIKGEMRSKRLLEESKMPGNMAQRQRLQEDKRRRKQQELNIRHKSKSADFTKMNKSIPDFSKIHREWEEEIRMSYKEPHITHPKPFNLLTEQRPFSRSTSDVEVVKQDNFNCSAYDAAKCDWNKSILSSLEIAKPPTNKSTILREMALRVKKQDEETKTHKKSIEHLAKRKREMEVSEKIRKSLEIDSLPQGEDKRRQKTKELLIENEMRKENYQRELNEMRKKVNQKPLLFETTGMKGKPPVMHNNENSIIRQTGKRKPTQYEDYDERNNFGDSDSYRSSTNTNCSLNGIQSMPRSDH